MTQLFILFVPIALLVLLLFRLKQKPVLLATSKGIKRLDYCHWLCEIGAARQPLR
jgi:hypothetical protein